MSSQLSQSICGMEVGNLDQWNLSKHEKES